MKPERSTIPERERTPEKRRPLTRAEFGQLMIDQEGKCACGCGEKLQPLTEGVIDEHIVPLALMGTNDLSNRRLFRKPCARKKTDAADTPRIAKARAQAGETGQRRQDRKRRQWPSQTLQSAPFDKRLRKKMNGSVVPRERE